MNKLRHVFIGSIGGYRKEDNGIKMVTDSELTLLGKSSGIYVILNSFDSTRKHDDLNKLIGRTIKVTIETIDQDSGEDE